MGTVRIGAPDAFSNVFLAPLLFHFRSKYPDLRIQLVPLTHSFSLSEREADLAVMVGRPEKGRLRVQKLVDYSLSLYASKSYLEGQHAPQNLEDLVQHTLIGYVQDLLYSSDINYTKDVFRDWQSDIEIATAIGQFEAVRAGVGIGICHDFLVADSSEFVQLFPERSIKRSYWMAWHENMRAAQRVKAVAEILELIVKEKRSLFMPHEAR